MVLDKTAVFAGMVLKKETVEIPGGEVIVSELSAEDYMSMFDSPFAKDGEEVSSPKLSALMCVRGMVGDDGQRIMADEDAEAFRKGSRSVFHKIVQAANRVNGLTGEEAKN